MKGIVFTEFLDLVELKFSAEMVDDIIHDSEVASKGIYTGVGAYPHTEMVALVTSLSKFSDVAVPDLLRLFGQHLFNRFYVLYPSFFEGVEDTLSFLSGIESIIHKEVKKLYPDALLPRFETIEHTKTRLVMRYISSRHLEELAEGLMLGCIEYFDTPIKLERRTEQRNGDTCEIFSLERQ